MTAIPGNSQMPRVATEASQSDGGLDPTLLSEQTAAPTEDST